MKPSAEATGAVGYVRVHGRNAQDWFRKDAGVNERYDYLYSPEELAPWVERTRAVAAETAETYVIANNHYRGQAMANGLMLRSMFEGGPVEAPPQLVAAYPDALAAYVRS